MVYYIRGDQGCKASCLWKIDDSIKDYNLLVAGIFAVWAGELNYNDVYEEFFLIKNTPRLLDRVLRSRGVK